MKKLIVLSIFILNISNIFAVINVEAKGGLAFVDKYTISNQSYSGRLSYTLEGEAFYESSPNTEVGIGIAYKYNSPASGTLYSGSSSDDMHLFDSFPVYGIAKYKFPDFKGFGTYAKFYLGMSWNQVGRYDYIKAVRPSLYTGIGFGLLYGNVAADLSYCMQETELVFVNPVTISEETKSSSHSSLNLTVGYRFELPWFK